MNTNMRFRFLSVSVVAMAALLGCATTRNSSAAVKKEGTSVNQKFNEDAEAGNQSMDDARISSDIKRKYVNDKLLTASNISVDTDHGVVTLKGAVANQTELDRALTLGRSVVGVRSIHSFLTMTSK